MKNFDDFKIKFVGLKEGKHDFNYHVDQSFFTLFDYSAFNDADVNVALTLDKKSTLLELHFTVSGSVNVNCDVSNVPYDQPIKDELDLVVKFGDRYDDDNDEILILPRADFYLEVQQYIYEAIILAVPYKKVHPQVADGTMDSKILDKLEELSPGSSSNENKNTDPRWDKLKDLLNE